MNARRAVRAFSMMELLVVMVIIGIFATLAVFYYAKVVEKSRTAEAKAALMEIRTIRNSFLLENASASVDTSLDTIYDFIREHDDSAAIDKMPVSCSSKSFYRYSITSSAAVATRCTSGGKAPDADQSYTITMDFANGTFNGTQGYY